MSAETVALEHYRRRRRLVRAVEAAVRRAWAQINLADLDRSWLKVAGPLLTAVTGAQLAAAAAADTYLTEVLAQQDISAAAGGRLAPRLLAGIASDGRPLASLLQHSIITVKTALGDGARPAAAMASGYARLTIAAATQVADAGRVGDQVALAARRQVGGYTRMLSGKSCSRCVILAGKWYRWNQGFRRHPKCDCVHIPTSENLAGDLRTDPRRHFASLSQTDQDRTFTKAGAEAIRAGADPAQVVNARRGTYVAGERQLTTTGSTRRGLAGGRLGATRGRRAERLMPEQIFREAGGDRDEAIRLLRANGYIV